jgi:hypothetical protein
VHQLVTDAVAVLAFYWHFLSVFLIVELETITVLPYLRSFTAWIELVVARPHRAL